MTFSVLLHLEERALSEQLNVSDLSLHSLSVKLKTNSVWFLNPYCTWKVAFLTLTGAVCIPVLEYQEVSAAHRRVMAPEIGSSFERKAISPHFLIYQHFCFIFNVILLKYRTRFVNQDNFTWNCHISFCFTHVHLPCVLGLDNTFTRTSNRIFSSGSNKPPLPTTPAVLQ